ncbi:mannosyltransferase [Savitreella phatthalungensis]
MRTSITSFVLRVLFVVLIIYFTFVQLRGHVGDITAHFRPLQDYGAITHDHIFTETTTTTTLNTESSTAGRPTTDAAPISAKNITEMKSTFSSQLKDFWRDLATALEDARPECGPIEVQDGHPPDEETSFQPLNISRTPPSRLINFTDDQERVLFKSHYQMRVASRHLAQRLTFSEGAKGIVTTANAKYIPIFLVSLRMLRKTGCNLPVEVLIDNWSKYDPVVCESILPSMNAACVVLSELFDAAPNAQEPTSYQFKLFAMMFSSFQHVLFLDSDAFPVRDPTDLFTTAPYSTHGLVLWPDLWAITISEHYYHIAGIPYESRSSRYSTESGVILLDKEKHRESLLMMMFYNYYGPDYYYPLLCQGSHGAGDKETFVPAAMAVNAPWYQVKSGVGMAGFFEQTEFRLSALMQMDPRADYLYIAPSINDIPPADLWQLTDVMLGEVPIKPKPLFVHQNMHKLDPASILSEEGSTVKTKDGNHTRMWGPLETTIENFGYDMERQVWEVILEEGCRLEDRADVCSDLKSHFDEVFGSLEITHSAR